jgi:ribosomal protein S6--L-glutamate ligase
MELVTFNPFRTIGIPGIKYVKPEHMFREIERIKEADFLLFPEHWQVNSLVYGLHKKIYPSIEAIHLGHNKIEMTRALWTVCPEYVPYTEILASTSENVNKVLDSFSFPFVAKEIKNSMGNGVFLIENAAQFQIYASRNDVLYIQEYLPSDRDLRVCIVGEEIVAAYWRVADNGQFHHNVSRGGSISYSDISQGAVNLAAETAAKLHINHAGFDILISDGKPYILEFNVLFGNQGLMQNGISIEQKIYEYLLKQHTPTFPTTPLTPIDGQRVS